MPFPHHLVGAPNVRWCSHMEQHLGTLPGLPGSYRCRHVTSVAALLLAASILHAAKVCAMYSADADGVKLRSELSADALKCVLTNYVWSTRTHKKFARKGGQASVGARGTRKSSFQNSVWEPLLYSNETHLIQHGVRSCFCMRSH